MDNEDEDEEEGIYFDWVDISELCVVYVIVLFFFFFSFFFCMQISSVVVALLGLLERSVFKLGFAFCCAGRW